MKGADQERHRGPCGGDRKGGVVAKGVTPFSRSGRTTVYNCQASQTASAAQQARPKQLKVGWFVVN